MGTSPSRFKASCSSGLRSPSNDALWLLLWLLLAHFPRGCSMRQGPGEPIESACTLEGLALH
eukprot:3542036-Alexandrium_andersonii.AAC.1